MYVVDVQPAYNITSHHIPSHRIPYHHVISYDMAGGNNLKADTHAAVLCAVCCVLCAVCCVVHVTRVSAQLMHAPTAEKTATAVPTVAALSGRSESEERDMMAGDV